MRYTSAAAFRAALDQRLKTQALKTIAGRAAGDTCFLCEVGSNWVVSAAGQRSVRADGVGTCAKCRVHACPERGDRYGNAHQDTFRCADCLAVFGAATIAAGGLGPVQPTGLDPGAGEPDGPPASQLSAVGCWRSIGLLSRRRRPGGSRGPRPATALHHLCCSAARASLAAAGLIRQRSNQPVGSLVTLRRTSSAGLQ
jgi:hypothetical protein